MSCTWFFSWDWWGNIIYLAASIAYVYLDISSGWFSGHPYSPIMTEQTTLFLWLFMAAVFVLDAAIYLVAWFSYAKSEAKTSGVAVRWSVSPSLPARIFLNVYFSVDVY